MKCSKKYKFKLNRFDRNDDYIDDLKAILNNREFFYKYDRYDKISKFIAIFSVIFYSLFFLYILFYNSNISDNVVIFSFYYTLFTAIFFIVIQPLWVLRLEKLLNKNIYEELDSNIKLQKWYFFKRS